MNVGLYLHASDIRGYSRLSIDATLGVTDLVEAVHHTIARVPPVLGRPVEGRTSGITGLVYHSVRGVTRLVGGSIDALLSLLGPAFAPTASSAEREAMLAAVNGVVGDYLASGGNPLAIPMRLRRDGHALELTPQGLAAAFPRATRKVVVFVHGLCKDDLQWRRNGHDHGSALAEDLGYTPVYLHYNSGLHISTNGRAFGEQLEALLQAWPAPVDELVIIGHSQGGLVARSAYHYARLAGHAWPASLRKMVFLGTPHHGTVFERGGNWLQVVLGVSPYTAAFARLGKIRSAAITDLRYGSLLDEDWEHRDRFARAGDTRRPVPLPEGVQCYAVGATTAAPARAQTAPLLGDGLVPLHSALGRHRDPERNLPFPPSQQWVGYGMSHLDLLDRPEVYERIRYWLAISGK